MNNRLKGRVYEGVAIKYLLNLGYSILERNFHYRGGEIDLIAIKDKRLKFIEVKYRSSNTYGNAVDALTRTKYRNILLGIRLYTYKHKLQEIDIDIEAVLIDKEEIKLISYDLYY